MWSASPKRKRNSSGSPSGDERAKVGKGSAEVGMIEFWAHILRCLGGETELLSSFKEAVLSACNPRLQLLLCQNDVLFRNRFLELLANSQPFTSESAASESSSSSGHVFGLRCGTFIATPSWKGQFQLVIDSESLSLSMFDFTRPALPPTNLSGKPGISFLRTLRTECLSMETSAIFKLSIPCESISGLWLAKVSFNTAVLAVDLSSRPTYQTRIVHASVPSRNKWTARSDFSQDLQFSRCSRMYLFLPLTTAAELARTPQLCTLLREGIDDADTILQVPYQESVPLTCPRPANISLLKAQSLEEVIKLDHDLLVDGCCGEAEDRSCSTPCWEPEMMAAEDQKKTLMENNVFKLLSAMDRQNADCSIM